MTVYNHNINIKRDYARKRKIYIFAGSILLTLLIFFGWITYDILTTTTIDQPTGQTLNVSDERKYTYFDEGDFTFRLQGRWSKSIEDNSNYKMLKYTNIEPNYNGRILEIYTRGIKPNIDYSKVYKIKNESVSITPLTLSQPCRNYSEPADKNWSKDAPAVPPSVETTWEEVKFNCNFNRLLNMVVAGSKEDGSRLRMVSTDGSKSFVFTIVYTDHSINPDLSVYEDMLRSWQMK